MVCERIAGRCRPRELSFQFIKRKRLVPLSGDVEWQAFRHEHAVGEYGQRFLLTVSEGGRFKLAATMR